MPVPVPPSTPRLSALDHITSGIVERREFGCVILSPEGKQSSRRVLFVNSYGGGDLWRKVKVGEISPHHLWGCLELVRMGYEVALAEPVADFSYRGRPFPHDLTLLKAARSWLGRDGIIYCGHNVLFWIPFLKAAGLLRRAIVSLLFANETLDFSRSHTAIIALTPTAAQAARKLAPRAKVAHLGWGADLRSYPHRAYSPRYMLHCGIAGRDFPTLNKAASHSSQPIRIIASEPIGNLTWPANVEVIDSGRGYNHEDKRVSFSTLVNVHYAQAAASLIVTIPNPQKNHALGFTNLIEAMALGKPIIHTHTGALADEINVETSGCGLSVPPGDHVALARAMDLIANDRARAEAMGLAARRLAEAHYNIDRYAAQLDQLFSHI